MIPYDTCLFHLEIPSYPLPLQIIAFDSQHHGINSCFQCHLTVRTTQSIQPESLLHQTARLQIHHETRLEGDIRDLHYLRYDSAGFYYSIIIASPLLRMRGRPHHRVFLQKTPEEIVKTLLEWNHWPFEHLTFNLSKPSLPLESFTQYDETDLDFFVRLLQERQWTYLLDQQDQHPQLLIMDSRLRGNDSEWLDSCVRRNDNGRGKNNKPLSYHKLQIVSSLDQPEEWHVQTDQIDLKLLDRVKLAPAPDQVFQIIHLDYQGEENSGLTQRLKIHAILLPMEEGRISQPSLHPPNLGLQLAKLDSRWSLPPRRRGPSRERLGKKEELDSCFRRNDNGRGNDNERGDDNLIDEQGCYQVTYPLAESPFHRSSRIPQAQDWVYDHEGLHFALHPDTPVMVLHPHEQPENPVILGCLPQDCSQSSWDQTSNSGYHILTQHGHSLLLDDSPNVSSLTLKTADSTQVIQLEQGLDSRLRGNDKERGDDNKRSEKGNFGDFTTNASSPRTSVSSSHLILQNHQGSLEMEAGLNLHWTNEGKMQKTLQGQEWTVIGEEDHQQIKKSLRWTTSQQFLARAEKNYAIHSQQQLHLTGKDSLSLHAKNHHKIKAGQQLTLQALKQFESQAKRGISIHSPRIVLRTGLSSLTISHQQAAIEGLNIQVLGILL